LTPAHRFDRVTAAIAQAMESSLASSHSSAPCHPPTAEKLTTLYVDQFASASPLARLWPLVKSPPRMILSDLFRGQLGIPLPPGTLVITVTPPKPSAAYWQPDRLAGPVAAITPQDAVVCFAEAHRRLFIAAGVKENQIRLVPLAVNPAPQARPISEPGGPLSIRHRVAILADIPTLDPAKYGLELPSHVELWQAACKLAKEEAWSIHPEMVSDIFRRAQRRAGVTTTDPALVDSLERGIRQIMLASVPLLTMAEQLAEMGIDLKLIGEGWTQAAQKSQTTWLTSPAVTTASWNDPELWEDVALVLHFSPDGSVHPALLEAPANGVTIVAVKHPVEGQAAGLGTILRANVDFALTTPTQMGPTLKGLLHAASKRQALAASATAHLQTAHTWPHRLASFIA
jgi:hypothetical protein